MIIYRYNFFKNRKKEFLSEFNKEKIILFFIGLFFFFFIILIGQQIIKSIQKGIERQKITEKVNNDIKNLEKENIFLRYKDNLSSNVDDINQTETKNNEKIYSIILPTVTKLSEPNKQDNTLTNKIITQKQQEQNYSNWKKWTILLFE